MKKFLSWIFLAVMAVASLFGLSACGEEKPAAESLIKKIIVQEAGTTVTDDFELVSEIQGYKINWVSNNACLAISDKATDNKYTVTVTRPTDARQEITITATIKVKKGNEASREFKFYVAPYDVYDFTSEYQFAFDGRNVCGEFELPQSYTLKGTNETCTISWVSLNEDLISISGDKAEAILSFEKLPAKLTATFTYKNESTTVEYDVTVFESVEYPVVTEPQENTAYKYGFLQVTLDSTYYWFMGGKEGNYGTTSKDYTEGVDMYVEKSGEGYNIALQLESGKKYLNLGEDHYIKIEDTATTVWLWNTEYNTFTTDIASGTYYMGTYSSYATLSASVISYAATSFVGHLYLVSDIENSTPEYEDDVMVGYEVKNYKLSDQAAGTIELPNVGNKFSKVSISYAVKEGADYASVEGNILTLAEIKNDAEVTLTVTFKSNDYEESIDVTFTLLAYVEYAKELVEGLTYKLAFVQGNKGNATYYFTGAMNGFYGAASDDSTKAVDVFVEAVEGGYNLAFTDSEGAKKYITVVQSGTYTNFTIADAASTVWTWNEDYYTLTTVLGEETYYLGTYNTYTTFSVSKLSKADTSFVAHFYEPAVVEYPAVEAEYLLGFVQGNLEGATYYFTGTMNGFYGAASTNRAEAVNVFVEAVEGGYNLAFTDSEGTKKYITLVQSGTYTNFTIADAASTVWTWNEEYNTLVTVLGEETYYLGTYGTNKTFGASKISYAATSFVANLYGYVNGEAPSTDEPEEPETPEIPEEVTKSTIAQVLAAEVDTVIMTEGLVVAAEATQYVIYDGNDFILVYAGSNGTVPAVGTSVKIDGKRSAYGNTPQITPTNVETITALDVTAPKEASAYTSTEIDAYIAASVTNAIYVKYTGTLSVSGNYFNVVIEGTNNQGSLKLSSDLKASATELNGAVVTIEGYAISVSSSKYMNTIVTKIEGTPVEPEEPETPEIPEGQVLATFNFGADDATKTNEANQDGSSVTEYTETSGNYTITLTDLSKVYSGSYDAVGNACLKMGTGSAAGTFTFTVDEDVDYVIIKVAGYKAKTAAITINGGDAQTISTLSQNGEYTEIVIDTTTTKTVTFATTSAGYRCKVTSIEYYSEA